MSPAAHAPIPDRWSKRLALGLPVLVLLLVVTSSLLVGSVLTAGDLEARYVSLVAEAEGGGATAVDATAGVPRAPSPPEERPDVHATLVLTEFGITADIDEVPAWATVTFDVVNEGSLPHDAAVGATASPMLDSGESGSFTVEAGGAGVLELICTVPGHSAAGMTLELPIVGGDTGAGADEATADGTGSGGTAAASPANAAEYDGDRPALERRDPSVPPAPDTTVHDLTWTVEEKVVQVSEDVWQEVWTFDGQAPGPTLRVKVGDTINLTLRNPAEAVVGHSIDFHASQVAWNDEMRTINPGEELLYAFEATHAGVFMYHCGTAPALHHIGNAMHGMIIVEPADGLPEVDHELFFVQHEYYLGPQGEPGDLAKMAQGAPSPDLVVFNGVADQYLDNPIEVGVGERIRAWVLNSGPSVDSSFHVVGTIFDTAVKEGVALRPDNPGRWGSQAMDLAPAQGGYVEFSLAEDGLYPIVTHAFNHVGRGALGLLKAGTGGDATGGGH
jgi:nitrite reductase (NO-forming)